MGTYLLGTRVLWELLRGDHPLSHPVKAWMKELTQADSLFISAISLGHIKSDIESVPDPMQRSYLLTEFQGLENQFQGLTLPFCRAAIDRWSLIRCNRTPGHGQLTTEEAQVLATALHYGKTYVAEKTSIHETMRIHMVDPWKLAPRTSLLIGTD